VTTIGVVAASAGGVETIRAGLIQPLIDQGFQVAVTLTPTAAEWLEHEGEVERIANLTHLPVRWQPRRPSEPRPHPQVDLYVAAPLTANSVAKLALGLADNQALTALCESITTVPMIVFPRINAAHARQPEWPHHIERLRSVGVHLIYGDDVWPLAEPRAAGPRKLPWPAILKTVHSALPS
jgi:phosphopantothenoylcysteine synthetase/decarboxylase